MVKPVPCCFFNTCSRKETDTLRVSHNGRVHVPYKSPIMNIISSLFFIKMLPPGCVNHLVCTNVARRYSRTRLVAANVAEYFVTSYRVAVLCKVCTERVTEEDIYGVV